MACMGLAACVSNGNLGVDGLAALPAVQSIEVRALEGVDCSAYPTVESVLDAAPLAVLRALRGEDLVGQLPNRAHVVVALAFDATCTVVGSACTPASPGRDVILLMSSVTPQNCTSCRLEDGLCLVGDSPDSGGDGGMDTGSDVELDTESDARTDADTSVDMGSCFDICGEPPMADGDVDGDGIRDQAECPGLACPCDDTDNDGIPNYCDIDSDNDGYADDDECSQSVGCEEVRDPDVRLCDGGLLLIFDATKRANCGFCDVACDPERNLQCEESVGRLRCRNAEDFPFQVNVPMGDAEEVTLRVVPLSLDPVPVPLPSPTFATGPLNAPFFLAEDTVYTAFEEGGGVVTTSRAGEVDRRLGMYGVLAEYDGRCMAVPNLVIAVADELSTSAAPLYAIPMHDQIPTIYTGWAAYRRPSAGDPYEWTFLARTPAVEVSMARAEPCALVALSADDFFTR